MKRQFLFSFFETPQGKLLQISEKNYLKHSITVSCKQTIIQIGHLGWENKFIDCSLYQRYNILDAKAGGFIDAIKIQAKSCQLPIQSDSVDLILLPHLLEFDIHRFQTMREIERVLKPEGEVIILNFNPLSVWVRMQFLWNLNMSDSWKSHFISRSRILDWLKLLNFEIQSTTEFTLDSTFTTSEQFKLNKYTFSSMSYAVRAVKRRYTLIPLTPIKTQSSRLIPVVTCLESSTQRTKKYD